VVYLLCGLTGSGKTTYATELESKGVVRLALDEEVHALHERDGVVYPDEYLKYETEAKAQLKERLQHLIQEGKDVVLDYGFWRKEDRDAYKKLIEAAGDKWKLLYFKAEPAILLQRLQLRNERTDANALTVTPDMLQDFIVRFEVPHNEGEEVHEQRN
jgi:predicted kinase